MSVQRIFYVTQSALEVWDVSGKVLLLVASFVDDDDGLRHFDAFMNENASGVSAMLVDVIEEEFALETIPKLGFRDRNALLERRVQRRFRRTPYRFAEVQGKVAAHKNELNVVLSAISNHELLEPWLQIVLRHRSPLTGVYSIPHLAPLLLKQLFTTARPVMFIAAHQGNKLRQVFMRDGYLRNARLSRATVAGDAAFAQQVVTETLRSRRYLERARLLRGDEVLDVFTIADAVVQQQILALSNGDDLNRFSFVDPTVAAGKVGCADFQDESRCERLYLSMVTNKRPRQSYAVTGEKRYWYMSRLRKTLLAGGIGIAAVCSVASALLLTDAWSVHDRVENINSQVEQLSATLRRENKLFDSIRANSYEMKQAVDTGDFILENRVPVPWVLNQLGQVLGDYPDVQLRQLRWFAESTAVAQTLPQHRGDAPVPVSIPAVDTVSAVLTAELIAYDGNLRAAFARIDELAADIQARTYFGEAYAVQYPLNTSISVAVSGEINNERENDNAQFQLRVVYQVPQSTATQWGDDEAI
jgi:hypothetical protein